MPIDFKQDFTMNPGVAEGLSPLVTRVLAPNPSPFTYTGTGTFIVGTEKLAVIDPGPEMPAHGEALMKAIGDREVSHILVTHTHRDHSPLSRWLKEQTGAPILAFGPHGAGRRAGLEGEDVEAGADKDFAPDVTLADGEVIEGPDWTITALHTPGHTSNHMCFHLSEEDTIFVGDHVMAWATTVILPPDGDVRAYLTSLERLVAMNPALLRPTHGPEVDKPARFMRAIIGHRRMREAQIVGHLEAGIDNIDMMVERMYREIDPRLFPAAARSVLAHLIALVDDGRVIADPAPGLEARYRLS